MGTESSKKALISGYAGQDGTYLNRLLLAKGYRVLGIGRSVVPGGSYPEGIDVRSVDITDAALVRRTVGDFQPDEVYNLAGLSSVSLSWQQPAETGLVNGVGAVNLMEALRLEAPHARFYQATSSEMFGTSKGAKKNESSHFHPRSPYAASKLYAHWMTVNYRESFGLYACSGILFNHESPLRPKTFVTRKITDGVARIKLGLAKELRLGNVDVQRDWGHAQDYVRAMWLMLQQDQPEDFVIATGKATSVRAWCELAFAHVGLSASDYLAIDPSLMRPADIDAIYGDSAKAAAKLGWQPDISLHDIVAEMVEADLAAHEQRLNEDVVPEPPSPRNQP